MANNKQQENLEQINNDNFTPTLHLCNGFLGGAGKSTLARLFCEKFIKLGRLFTLIDADPNYNVARAYDRETVAFWQHKDIKEISTKESTQGRIRSR
jgi:CO dehydrogenase nickel-insertion accessory protein CooC1